MVSWPGLANVSFQVPSHKTFDTRRNPISSSVRGTDALSANGTTPADPEVHRPRSWFGFDAGILVVLALPWTILHFDTSWLFGYATSSNGFIDPWVYFGFFLDLAQHIRTFKGAYFTTRLTWTVPGALVYHAFSPVVATYVLHLAVFYAATLSLYMILKLTVGRRAALLATLLMAFHSYFLLSVGWPYIDGAANAYFLLTILALTFAARSPLARNYLVAAGALAALAVYCQLFLIVFSPVVLGYYYFARRQMGHARSSVDWKPFTLGFAAVTLAFGLFNLSVNGRFLFFINSVGEAAKLVVNHNPYADWSYRWLSGPTWLVVPTVALVGAIVCLANRKRIGETRFQEFRLFWLRFYVLCVATMIFWQLVGQPVLQLPHYASYLMPAAFLALGSQIALVADRLNRMQFALLCGCVGMVSLLPIPLPMNSSLVAELQRHRILLPLAIGVAAIWGIGRQLPRVAAPLIGVLALGLATLSATTSTRGWDHGGLPNDPASQKAALLAIVDSVHAVQALSPQANLYFWYNVDGRFGKIYRAVASTYLWAYRLEGEEFPQLGPKLPPVQRRILILSENGDAALRDAIATLNRAGLGARFIARRSIREGPFAWDMEEIEVKAAVDQ
jgi:4-amino-4-deoxy-L-arabinose transferase-like glycosyltransferase